MTDDGGDIPVRYKDYVDVFSKDMAETLAHQQKTFPSGWNGCVRVDALSQSRQRHPGGRLLHARGQYDVSRSISPSDRRFAVSSRSVSLLY
jgi:hypothetical protein